MTQPRNAATVPAEETDALETLARQWHQEARASEHLTAQVRAALQPRSAFAPPRYLVPAAASLCVLVVLGGSIGLSTLRPPSAIAAVRQAMQAVHTARWQDETVTRTVPGGVVLRDVPGTTTVDLDRLAGRVETGTSEVYIRTRTGVAWKRNGKDVPDNRVVTEAELAQDLRRRLLPDAHIQGRGKDWVVSEEVQAGRPVRHFVLQPSPQGPQPATIDGGNVAEEFWADAATNRIVATRYQVTRRDGNRMVMDTFTTRNYQYDVPVKAATFQP